MVALARSKVWSGARALVYVNNLPNSGTGSSSTGGAPATDDGLTLVGLFSTVSYSFSYLEQDIDILGRFGPVQIEYVGATTVSGSCSGWRVVDNGPMAMGLFPTMDQLLNYSDLVFKIVDRQDSTKVFCQISNIKPLNYSSGTANKSASTFSMDFKGLIFEEDNVVNAETKVPTLPI
jgi:hypothetical protein